jgi:hypothetical protein
MVRGTGILLGGESHVAREIASKQYGWGYMDPKVWAELSDTYVALEQMPRPVKPDQIMTNALVAMAKTLRV